MKQESGLPDLITCEHIGMRVLFRLPNNAIAKEGIIDELSPGGDYIHIGKTWIENNGRGILSILSAPQKRREGIR